MEYGTMIAGFGGQGVLFTGRLLAEAALSSGYQVTWYPSYGPEQRGGTCHAAVVISSDPIGSPVVDEPDYLLVLNQPSWEKFSDTTSKTGYTIYNSDLVSPSSTQKPGILVPLPASHLAKEAGDARVANMVLFGALLRAYPGIPMGQAQASLRALISPRYEDLLSIDLKCIDLGYAAADKLLSP
jgi:2-oxoglutarate ferredoxin oxidoreductase subunit gamma